MLLINRELWYFIKILIIILYETLKSPLIIRINWSLSVCVSSGLESVKQTRSRLIDKLEVWILKIIKMTEFKR